jgi:hypothetical protein
LTVVEIRDQSIVAAVSLHAELFDDLPHRQLVVADERRHQAALSRPSA